jgi:hypothetical protein
VTVAPPLALVRVDERVLSSYDAAGQTGGPRSGLRPLARLGKAGVATPDTAEALLALSNAVGAAGGDLRVTECHRDVVVQRLARARYDRWVAAGRPAPSSPGFDRHAMKAAFVARPGRSMHNAGRAIDVHVSMLRFPGARPDEILDRLWAIAEPLGWSPVIRRPDENASEAWHFDYWGPLASVRDRLGYEQAALCGAVLVGHGDLTGYAALVQALLVLSGSSIGQIDGDAGPRTLAALADALGCSSEAAARVVRNEETSSLAVLSRRASLP